MPRAVRALGGLILCGAGLGCESPPTKELTIAEAALQRALDGDAEVFALSTLDEAEAALAAARQNVKQREYRAALSAALDSTQKSRQALSETEAAKRTLAGEAQGVVGSAEESLRRAEGAVGARRGSLTAPRRSQCRSLLDQARDFTDTLGRHLGEADLVAVHEEVPVVREAIAKLDEACGPAPKPSPRPSARKKAPVR